MGDENPRSDRQDKGEAEKIQERESEKEKEKDLRAHSVAKFALKTLIRDSTTRASIAVELVCLQSVKESQISEAETIALSSATQYQSASIQLR